MSASVTTRTGSDMTPEQTDRVVTVAAMRYRAMSSADFRRQRREARWGAVRAWICWALHI